MHMRQDLAEGEGQIGYGVLYVCGGVVDINQAIKEGNSTNKQI